MGDNLSELQKAIETLHNCCAKHQKEVWAIERFQGQTVWEGTVQIFYIQGHPKATICYAWSSPVKGSAKQRIYAVLRLPPVESPEDAVRAAIRREYEE